MQHHSYTIPNSGKARNGDHLLVKDFNEEKILVALVADGVGGQPCDWKASEMACEHFLFSFQYALSDNLLDRIHDSINDTNIEILSEISEECMGMASTLSVMVWPYETDQFCWCSIGDSRIYKVDHATVNCISKDDTVSHSGKQSLTEYLGKNNLKFHISEENIEQGALILLCSDGFYTARKASMNQKLIELSRAADFEAAFHELTKNFAMLRGDDFTVVAVRKG
ncbi:MAG: protein phosphatase 2C domain-containing protein [Cyclobacteriaceae bacterium]